MNVNYNYLSGNLFRYKCLLSLNMYISQNMKLFYSIFFTFGIGDSIE